MTSLADWLLQQIADDEAAARRATPGPWRVCAEGSEGSRIAPDCEDKRQRTRFIGILNGRVQPEDGYNAAHIARHDPARVLARCKSDREIVEKCAYATDPAFDGDYDLAPRFDLADDVLRALATPYADRPGFEETWR